jgi:hypothetical protein
MDQSRRKVLNACFAGIASVFLQSGSAAAQNPAQGLPPASSPRRDPGSGEDSANPANSPAAVTKAVLEQHQKDIKKDVERLFDLAKELKTEVEKIDATTVLSMAMVRKTEEIEKLARQIRDRAKG